MDIQGHRGCRGLMPENSLPAFEKAIKLGITTLELDVVISKDEKVVVSHEPYMNHEIALNSNGEEISKENEKSYNLFQMTYDSIRLFDCGSKPQPRFPKQKNIKVYKPLLSEVIKRSDAQSKTVITYNIEIKSQPSYDGIYTPEIQEFVSLVLDVIIAQGVTERVILQSFDLRVLEEVKKQNPKITTAILVDVNENISKKLSKLSYKPDIISPYFKLLDEAIVTEFKSKDYKVIPWTVNSYEDIILMQKLKVDGIISDYPNLVLRTVNEHH